MTIRILTCWTAKPGGGLGLGISATFPCRCSDVQSGRPGTLTAAGIGIGLLVFKIYLDFTWGFVPFNE